MSLGKKGEYACVYFIYTKMWFAYNPGSYCKL